MKESHLISALLLAIALAGIRAPRPALAQDFGSFSLKPGETRQIRIGATYRTIRLCNDSESTGELEAMIGDSGTHRLAPGICVEDTGASLALHNLSNGTVSGIYRRVYDFFDGN